LVYSDDLKFILCVMSYEWYTVWSYVKNPSLYL